MWIVAIGSIDQGHKFTGPFNSEAEAQAWIDRQDTRMAFLSWPIRVETPAFAERIIKFVAEEHNG